MSAIKKIDHLVITVKNAEHSITFYKTLGFSARDVGNRYELFAGDFKINMHLCSAELTPHASFVQPGSADLCFELDGSLEAFKKKLQDNQIVMELEIVERTGTRGKMRSLYIRDPDGNLLEFCSYQ